MTRNLTRARTISSQHVIRQIKSSNILLARGQFRSTSINIRTNNMRSHILNTRMINCNFFRLFISILATTSRARQQRTMTTIIRNPFHNFSRPQIIQGSRMIINTRVGCLAAYGFSLHALQQFSSPFTLMRPYDLSFNGFLLRVFFSFSMRVHL